MAAEWVPMSIFVFCYVFVLRILHRLWSRATDTILRNANKIDPKEEALVTEMKKLVAEQQFISAQDEFAKYARLQRKIVKINDEITSHGSMRRNAKGSHKIISQVFVMVLICLLHITFLIKYRKEQVILLPQQWFYPMNSLLSFPTGISGAIGLPCWMITCNKVIEKFVV